MAIVDSMPLAPGPVRITFPASVLPANPAGMGKVNSGKYSLGSTTRSGGRGADAGAAGRASMPDFAVLGEEPGAEAERFGLGDDPQATRKEEALNAENTKKIASC